MAIPMMAVMVGEQGPQRGCLFKTALSGGDWIDTLYSYVIIFGIDGIVHYSQSKNISNFNGISFLKTR